jgi:hypothetical protein
MTDTQGKKLMHMLNAVAMKRQRGLLGWANDSDSRSDDKAKGWAGIYVCDVAGPSFHESVRCTFHVLNITS